MAAKTYEVPHVMSWGQWWNITGGEYQHVQLDSTTIHRPVLLTTLLSGSAPFRERPAQTPRQPGHDITLETSCFFLLCPSLTARWSLTASPASQTPLSRAAAAFRHDEREALSGHSAPRGKPHRVVLAEPAAPLPGELLLVSRLRFDSPPQPNSDTKFSGNALPADVDAVIIGSGISGALIAHGILARDPNARLLMLDARNVCNGASGRNGQLNPHHEHQGLVLMQLRRPHQAGLLQELREVPSHVWGRHS